MTGVQELYETAVRIRPTSERLQLAAMILNEITHLSSQPVGPGCAAHIDRRHLHTG